MKHTAYLNTSTGGVTLDIEVACYVPLKGDTLNIYGYEHVLTEGMRPIAEVEYSKDKGYYATGVRMTKEAAPRVVFYGDGFSWRQGEYFEKADSNN